MKNDQYFPLEASIIDDDRVCRLIERNGIEGFGIYIFLLKELRRRENYCLSMQSLPRIARHMRISMRKLLPVITSYDLFRLDGDLQTGLLSSPYLDRVMTALEEKRERSRKAGIKRMAVAKRAADGRFTVRTVTVKKSKEEKSKEEESKEEESKVKKSTSSSTEEEKPEATAIKSWESYLNEALSEQSWIELTGKQSGLGMDFINHLPFIIRTFREHILTQGTENSILSLRDAKSYFINFMRNGTPTNKRMRELLEMEKQTYKQVNPFRYEMVDPVTGARSYCGIPIPADAPPRPGENSLWNPVDGCWDG